jgi:hypothetical protein
MLLPVPLARGLVTAIVVNPDGSHTAGTPRIYLPNLSSIQLQQWVGLTCLTYVCSDARMNMHVDPKHGGIREGLVDRYLQLPLSGSRCIIN